MNDFLYGCKMFYQALKYSAIGVFIVVFYLFRHPIQSYDAIKWAWKHREEF